MLKLLRVYRFLKDRYYEDNYQGFEMEGSKALKNYNLTKCLIMKARIAMNKSDERIDFELFKSNVCHKVKYLGEVTFVEKMKESTEIREYEERKWYAEMFYLIGMMDYLCRKNNLKKVDLYDDLREYRLPKVIHPLSLLTLAKFTNNPNLLEEAYENGIEEFKVFNIVENEVETSV